MGGGALFRGGFDSHHSPVARESSFGKPSPKGLAGSAARESGTGSVRAPRVTAVAFRASRRVMPAAAFEESGVLFMGMIASKGADKSLWQRRGFSFHERPHVILVLGRPDQAHRPTAPKKTPPAPIHHTRMTVPPRNRNLRFFRPAPPFAAHWTGFFRAAGRLAPLSSPICSGAIRRRSSGLGPPPNCFQ